MKKKLPIGISDFKRVIEDDYYYFDKTVLRNKCSENWHGIFWEGNESQI